MKYIITLLTITIYSCGYGQVLTSKEAELYVQEHGLINMDSAIALIQVYHEYKYDTVPCFILYSNRSISDTIVKSMSGYEIRKYSPPGQYGDLYTTYGSWEVVQFLDKNKKPFTNILIWQAQ